MKGADEVLIGATASVKATVKPSVKVSYKSSDEAVATVDAKGTVKGVKAGTATITATAKVGTKTLTATKDVVVKNGITEFKAVTPKKLTVKFAGALESIAKENFTLTDAKGAKVAIQKATLDETKTIVTIDLYSELTTGAAYSVAAKIGEDTFTESLNFVKGAVAKIVAANQIVKAGEDQTVKYNVYDENGLDITDSTPVTFSANVDINPTTGVLNLPNGVLAYVTITYVNPTTGAEVKSETFTVTGSTAAATSVLGVTVDTAAPAAWPAKVVTTIAKGDTTKKLFAQYADQYNAKYISSNNGDVTFESLDPTIMIVDAKTGEITTLAEGTAQVKVTAGTASQLFTITVTAPAKATKLALDSSSNLKASLTNKDVNTASVKLNVLDQNGKNYNDDAASKNLTYTLTSGAGVIEDFDSVGTTDSATAGVSKTFTAKATGTATFKVTSNAASLNYVMVSITVYANDVTVVKYGFTGIKDLDIEAKHNAALAATGVDYKTTISLNALNKDGFVVNDTTVVSAATITVTKPDKTTTTITNGATDNFAFEAVGAYTITAAANGTTIASATINVKDTGVKPVVTIKKNTVAFSDVSANFNDNFATEDGWDISGVKFISGNSRIIASAQDSETSTLTKVSDDGDVTLYNVVVIVTKGARTFEVATNQSIKVTGVR